MVNQRDIRICNTEDLRLLLRHASQKGFNRQAPEVSDMDLDPDGKHILGLLLYGHNIDSAAVLHHRVRLLVKITDRDDPYETTLDIADRDWKRLVTAEAFAAQISS